MNQAPSAAARSSMPHPLPAWLQPAPTREPAGGGS